MKENIASGIEWKWNIHDYDLWRGSTSHKPIPTAALEQKKLVFDVNDITHIIVEQERQISDMINYIEKLKQIGGLGKPITDNERKQMYTKLISMEKK